MKTIHLLSFVGAAVLLVGSVFFIQGQLDNSPPLNAANLTTVRNWNTCVDKTNTVPCVKVPNKYHQACYFANVDTQNCLLLEQQVCIDFFNFSNNKNNLDQVLPVSFTQCVSICQQFALEDANFYPWFNQKYNVCSQA